MHLTLCDSCRRVVDPADLDGGRGARLGNKAYCADCVPGGAGRPADVGSCRDCQVSVVHSALTGGDELEFRAHPICSHCEKNPSRTPVQPATVGCAGCGTAVRIQDLRIGVALPLGEQAWCGACRHKPEQAQQTRDIQRDANQAQQAATSAAAAPPPPVAASESAPAQPEPPAPANSTGLACDTCRRAIEPDELRTGSAAVVSGTVLCSRCRGRTARQAAQRRASTRYAASLVFVLGVFPLASAALAIVIYRAVTERGATVVARDDDGDRGDLESQRRSDTPTHPHSPATAGRTPATADGGTEQGPSNAELRSLFAEMLKAMAARERAGTGAPPARVDGGQPSSTPRPPLPNRFKPAPDERPTPGPGAGIAKSLSTSAAKQQETRLQDADPGIRLDAVLELASLTPAEATPALITALADKDAIVRSAAAKVAGKLEAGDCIEQLLQTLGDRDQNVRRSVAQALGRITKTEKFYLFEDFTEEQLNALRREIDKRRTPPGRKG